MVRTGVSGSDCSITRSEHRVALALLAESLLSRLHGFVSLVQSFVEFLLHRTPRLSWPLLRLVLFSRMLPYQPTLPTFPSFAGDKVVSKALAECNRSVWDEANDVSSTEQHHNNYIMSNVRSGGSPQSTPQPIGSSGPLHPSSFRSRTWTVFCAFPGTDR